MPESDLEKQDDIKAGDLVTYRSITELFKYKRYGHIVVYGIGIVASFEDQYAKVYWLNAGQFLWICLDKLTKIQNLDKLKSR